MPRLMPALLAFLLLPVTVAVAAGYEVRRGEDEDAMSLFWRDTACGTGPACDVAMLGCRAPGEFAVSALSLPRKETQAWVAKTRGAAQLRVDDRAFDLTADALDGMRDKSGRVGVLFITKAAPGEIWAALAAARRVTLAFDGRALTLAGDGTAPDLAALARACTATRAPAD